MNDWNKGINNYKSMNGISKKVTICTGTLVANFFQEKFIPLFHSFSNLDIQLKTIKNTFFGEDDVTVSGLLTGQDIITQLRGQELGDIVLFDIPQSEGMVNGKALDIMQLRPHDGYDSNLVGTSNYEDISD